MRIELRVNGEAIAADVEDRMTLGDFLRERLHLTGTHLACEHGVCGACTVLLDDEPVRSCITLAAAVDGRQVRTIEGFEDDRAMQVIRECFSEAHGLQCGYCTPGMVLAAVDLLSENPDPTDREIREGLEGNICRCTGYQNIVKSVSHAAGLMKEAEAAR